MLILLKKKSQFIQLECTSDVHSSARISKDTWIPSWIQIVSFPATGGDSFDDVIRTSRLISSSTILDIFCGRSIAVGKSSVGNLSNTRSAVYKSYP